MDYSDRVFKTVRSIINSPSLTLDTKIEQLNDTFLQSVDGVPGEMLEELFQQLFIENPPGEAELNDRAEIIPDLVDLLYGSLDDRRDPFDREQWHTIGEVVSEFGIELDESLLNYIMMRVVEHRAL
ncbi:MAG: hypothetical protein SVR04_05565 [Spirochaetota bacterium]|nr:hypothetical protein [Spirochaetota bacterium]